MLGGNCSRSPVGNRIFANHFLGEHLKCARVPIASVQLNWAVGSADVLPFCYSAGIDGPKLRDRKLRDRIMRINDDGYTVESDDVLGGAISEILQNGIKLFVGIVDRAGG